MAHYTTGEYDAANRRIGLTLPDTQQEAWGYDPAGRVNSLTQPGATPNTWTVSHDGAGNLTSLSAPNGGLESWGYDSAGRPITTTWTLGLGGTTLFSQTATLDAAGQRTQLQDSWGTSAFHYDLAGRLTSAAYPDGSTEADQYDPAGNRTVITSTVGLNTTVTTNQYDHADQLQTASVNGGNPQVTSYSYDGVGQQTGSSGPSGVVTNTYNDLHQLTHVTGPGTNLSLVLDGQGDRLRSYEQGTQTWTLQNDAQDLVGGLSSLASDSQNDYLYLSPGSGSAPLSAYTAGTQRTTYLGTDLLGSVRLATDPTGAVIGAGATMPGGTARPNTNNATASAADMGNGERSCRRLAVCPEQQEAN